MEPRSGRLVNGAVVLDDAHDLVEGSVVTVWIGDPGLPVQASPDELQEIDLGIRSATEHALMDARMFLSELRREG
ncbi:MAG: hypothetical protein IAG13_03345 [Deltaproteobacteria bacterium]|nr:hypothetical protein [Nannocystaceae bacterium]